MVNLTKPIQIEIIALVERAQRQVPERRKYETQTETGLHWGKLRIMIML